MPAESWLDSDDVVARVNLPNMRSPRERRIEVYARAHHYKCVRPPVHDVTSQASLTRIWLLRHGAAPTPRRE